MFLTTTFATLPSPAAMISGISDWSGPMFDALWPFALIAIGIFLGVFLVWFLINIFKNLGQKD
jgi:hypothetical protein